MKRSPVFILALALLAAAPQPLVVGSVRDQHGAVIPNARVTAKTRDGKVVSSLTDAQGTFALEAGGIGEVRVECRFCQETSVPVAADGTVTAIVHRFDALQQTGPSNADLTSLPYSHVQSVTSLTPFTIFENSSSILPGPQLSSRVIDPQGGLLIDAGIPNYDTTSGISSYFTTPGYYVQNTQVVDQTLALAYGDRANNGIFVNDPVSGGQDAALTLGTYNAARAGFAAGPTSASIGYSASSFDRAQRFDIATGGSLPAGSSWSINGLSEGSADAATNSSSLLESGFSGARVAFQQVRGVRINVDGTLDRGTNAYTSHGWIGSTWSDSDIIANISSLSGNGLFGSFAGEATAGLYDAEPRLPRIAATFGRINGALGTQEHTGAVNVVAALAYYNATYNGGSYQAYSAQYTDFVTPYVNVTIAPDTSHFSFSATGNGGYNAATLLEIYAIQPEYRSTTLSRNSTYQGELTYTDGQRVSASLIALTRTTAGFEPGYANSLGGSVAWQIAPTWSLRAWWMHAGFDETPAVQVYRFGVMPEPSNVGSTWLTYETSGLRVDAIWRQDLVDWQSSAHVDGSVSGPLRNDLRWFVGTEKYLNARTIEFGVRFAK